jgi:hypothetical protein
MVINMIQELDFFDEVQEKVNNNKPITNEEYNYLAATYNFDTKFISKAYSLRIENLAYDLLKNNPGVLYSAITIAEILGSKDSWLIDQIEKSLDYNDNIKSRNTQLHFTKNSGMVMLMFEFPKSGQI